MLRWVFQCGAPTRAGVVPCGMGARRTQLASALAGAVLLTACGETAAGRAPQPGDYLHCAYDSVSGQGLPENDPACAPTTAPDPSAELPDG